MNVWTYERNETLGNNYHTEIWKEMQIQRITAKICSPISEVIGLKPQ